MNQPNLNIKNEQTKGYHILHLRGKIDATSAPNLSSTLNTIIAKGNHQIICNMDQVDYISSAGIGTLLDALKKIENKKGKLRLAAIQPEVKDIFDLLQFTDLFFMTRDVEEALALDSPEVKS